MIELLQVQLDLAAAMIRAATSNSERLAWSKYYSDIKAMLDALVNPPRRRPQPPPIPTRP